MQPWGDGSRGAPFHSDLLPPSSHSHYCDYPSPHLFLVFVAQPLYQQYDAMRPWLWRVKHNGRGTYKILTKLMQWSTIRKGTGDSYRESQPIWRDCCYQPSALHLSQAWYTASVGRGVSVPLLRREKQNCGLTKEVIQMGTLLSNSLQLRGKNTICPCESATGRAYFGKIQSARGFKHCSANNTLEGSR